MAQNPPVNDCIWLAYTKEEGRSQVKSEYGGLVEMKPLPTHLLMKVMIFQDLNEDQIKVVAEKCVWAQFKSGREILIENDPTNDIFFILQGAVSAKSFAVNGREVTYLEIGTGGIFGEFSAIDGDMRAASITTAENSLVARMSSNEFRSVLIDFPVVSLRLCEHLVNKTRQLSQRIFEFSTLNVRHRIRAELVRICAEKSLETDGTVMIDPAPTHYELATRVSTHREAVSRELSQLANDGVLQLSRRSIKVLQPEQLRTLVDAAAAI